MSGKAKSTSCNHLTQEEKLYVEHVNQYQQRFHDWLRKEIHLSRMEKNCFQHDSIGDATTYWTSISDQSKADYDTQHQAGWKSWAKTSESVAAAGGQFLKDFAPLAEFASTSGPYGSLAVGIISGLFAIAQRKSKTNDIITSAMANVIDRLSGFQMLQEIYREDDSLQERLRGKITLAYYGVIELAVASAKYYLKSGIRRWWLATWNPQKFIVIAERVQGYVSAVRLQSDDLLSQAVNHIRTQNAILLREVAELKAEIKQLLKDENDNKLLSLQQILGLHGWSLENQLSSLNEYEETLERAHKDGDFFFEWMDKDTIAKYKENDEIFKKWETSYKSSMLLIIGSNHQNLMRREHCWISPLALDLIPEAQTSKMELVYHVFNFGDYTSIHTAVPKLFAQLLKLQKHIDKSTLFPKLEKYRIELDKIKNDCNESNDNHKHDKEAARRALVEVAITIVKHMDPQQRIIIVLDRVDRCKGREQRSFLTLLMQMIKNASCCVKILAVANKAYWEVEEYQMEPFSEDKTFEKVIKLQKTKH